MKAVRGNKEYLIDESQKKFYQDGGFDILGDDGAMVAYGRGKTVPYEDHIRAVKEIERLREMVEELRAENETLKTKQEPPKTPVEDKKDKAAKKEGE